MGVYGGGKHIGRVGTYSTHSENERQEEGCKCVWLFLRVERLIFESICQKKGKDVGILLMTGSLELALP
jgi:hypothetical protein